MPQVTIAQAAEIEAATKVIKMFEPGGPVWVLVGCFMVIGTVFVGVLLWFFITRGDKFLTSTIEQGKRQNEILMGCQLTLESQNETLKAMNKTQDRQEILLQEVLTHSRRFKPVTLDDHPHLPAPAPE